MATKSITRAKNEDVKTANIGTVAVEEVEEIVKTNTVAEKKTFAPTDLIPCKSNCDGELLIEGEKSKYMYTWAEYGSVEDVEYRDLMYMVHSPGNAVINEPRLIILDQDFVEQNPKLKTVYEKLSNIDDLTKIFSYTAKQMKTTIESLPADVKETVKNLAGSLIEQHRLDSVQKIKVLDEIFGTRLLLTLAER